MKLREFGLTKKFIKDMEIDIFKAPKCPCGCGESAYLSLEKCSMDDIVSTYILEVDCPNTLAIVRRHEETFLYFRSDISYFEESYDDETITCCVLRKNANVSYAIRKFIEIHEIHHVAIFDYGTFHNEEILNVIEN